MTPPFIPPDRDGFAEALLDWFETAMRPLPWRKTYDPYSVWISEIMLQQTQMERGVRYFTAWMRRFPDIRSVAEADTEDVLAAWEGLGYYSRARNLHAAARRILQDYGGAFPQTIEAIRTLPGVGEYTAGAIAAIAFNAPEPAVDANVLRIFSRLCDMDVPLAAKGVREFVVETVRGLIPAGRSRLFCQALMELGALVCGKTPCCSDCPLASRCLARQRGTTGERPLRKGETPRRELETAAAVIIRDGRVLIRKRPPRGLWAGLWEFPGGTLLPGETPEEALPRLVAGETGLIATVRRKIASVRHGYTIHRVLLHGFFCDVEGDVEGDSEGNAEENAEGVKAALPAKDARGNALRECAWVTPEAAAALAFPAGHRKLLEHLGWKG